MQSMNPKKTKGFTNPQDKKHKWDHKNNKNINMAWILAYNRGFHLAVGVFQNQTFFLQFQPKVQIKK